MVPLAGRRLLRAASSTATRSPRAPTSLPSIWLAHTRAATFPDPFAFRPERFLDGAPETYAWVPFGGGVRRCLGAAFAELEMRVVLQAVLRQTVLAPATGRPERVVRRNVTLAPARGTPSRAAGAAGGLSAVSALAATLAMVVGGGGAAGRLEGSRPQVRAVTTGDHSELVKTIPITRRRRAKPRVAMSLDPRALGSLRPGERLRLNGEVQVTLTCYRPGLPRCIGHSYSYSPKVETRLVLASRQTATSGPAAMPLSTWGGLTCSARRPDRNHHCVSSTRASRRASAGRPLPCAPDRCHVNMVVAAHDRHAGARDRLIIGTDRPNGTVEQDKGRLNAIEIAPRAHPVVKRYRATRPRSRTMPVKEDGGRRVVYSVRVPGLRRGDALAVEARQVTDISTLPYAAYVSDEIVLARGPRAVDPALPSVAEERGYVTEANGFNCTQGPSQFRTPCASSKAGAIAIRRDAVGPRSRPRPLYVNLVSRSKPKHVSAVPGDVARIKRGGFLSVVRYRP